MDDYAHHQEAPMATNRSTTRVPQQRTMPVYVTIDEAAKILAVSRVTVRKMISNGTLPGYQANRKLIRIRLEDLESAMQRIPAARW